MKDVIIDTLIDTAKVIPFLFFTFLIIEIIEHKTKKRNFLKSKKFGPLIGSLLGAIPQCGFSVSITNFYATRVITLGTLISVYLSTSDEMIPIMIGQNVPVTTIFSVIFIKIIIGMIIGYIIDFILRKRIINEKIENFCEHENCHCDENLFSSVIKHTLGITIFVLIITFTLNIIFEYLDITFIKNILKNNNFFGPIICSLIGLIPNCASSIMITEFYINGIITFGSLIAGLLTGCGIGIVVLFKTNKNIKENFLILLTIFLVGIIVGITFNLLNIMV